MSSALVCPRDGMPLSPAGNGLRCARTHEYPVVEGIPVLLRDDVLQTIGLAQASLAGARNPDAHAPLFLESVGVSAEQRKIAARLASQSTGIDPVAAVLVGATSGYGYNHLVGALARYPIPQIPLPAADGQSLLDIGCGWGRWSIAAARKGYKVTGIDPSLGALLAAQRICRAMGLDVELVCADARYLPFPPGRFDTVFSYSVLQHFDKGDAHRAIAEIARVLSDGGEALIQLASQGGIRGLYHRFRRGFREARGFEVRYWSRKEISAAFRRVFRTHVISPHCFFGLGLEPSDKFLMPWIARSATNASDFLCKASRSMPFLSLFADSVYVRGHK